MSNLFAYLKQEGLATTLKKAWNKFFHHTKSYTIFPRTQNIKVNSACNADIEVLTNKNLPEFEKIKFWSFINGSDYIDNPYQSIIMLKKGTEYIGYAAEEHEIERFIHG